jgi:voltage-gated potassium channel
MPPPLQSELARRGRSAFRLGATLLLIFSLDYYALGCLVGLNAGHGKKLFALSDDRWQLTECLYAAAITLTTVGYTDVLGTDRLELWRDAGGLERWVSNTDGHAEEGFDEASAVRVRDWSGLTRVVTAVHVIVGITFFLYVIGQVTSFFVEGAYLRLREERRTRRRLHRLRDHVIVCGVGETGEHALDAALETGVGCAAIDADPAVVERVRDTHPQVAVMLGDASEEQVLAQAGIERARGMLVALNEDGVNVVACVTARQLHPGLPLVSRAFGTASARRLVATGAAVVGTGRLAAMRLASELVRPAAVSVLDIVLRPRGTQAPRVEEVRVGAAAAGAPVARVIAAGFAPLGLQRGGSGALHFNPGPHEPMAQGDDLTVVGSTAELERLRGVLGSPSAAELELPPNVDVVGMNVPAGAASLGPEGPFEDHFIVCGAGQTGLWVVRELQATRRRFVVIERDPKTIEALLQEIPSLAVVEGDLREPDTLVRAGVERARGLAATLRSDQINLVAVVTALQMHPGLLEVSLAWDAAAARRLSRAGVRVVSKGRIGGRRMTAELLRPHLTGFLERMLVDERAVRVESVRVAPDSPVAGRTLAEVDLHAATGVRPFALVPQVGTPLLNPPPGTRLEPGMCLVAIGAPEEIARLVERVGSFE